MYKFDEDGWDKKRAEAGDIGPLAEGWLIGWSLPATDQRFTRVPRFLQIGTGQWCAAEFATLFPARTAAQTYAREFGIPLNGSVRIVRHRF